MFKLGHALSPLLKTNYSSHQVAWDQHGRSQSQSQADNRQRRVALYNEAMLTQKAPDDFRTFEYYADVGGYVPR